MGVPSKEESVLELFLNEPAKQWHFGEIRKAADISEPGTNKWLRKLLAENLVHRIKPRGKMPYFIANFTHARYRTRKRLYALQKLYTSGLLERLQNLKDTKAVVIFGSFSRSDWNTQSDVDIFVLGDPEDLRFGRPWSGLGYKGKARELQVHSYKSAKEVRKIRSGLMKNVVNGYFVKGSVFDVAEVKA